MHRVLIVEDEKKQLDMLHDTIKKNYPEWIIETANCFDSGEILIENSIRNKSPFSLFLLDIQLSAEKGDRGGFFLAEKIRQIPMYFQTPLLFLTAVSDKNYFALSNFHCYNYISKPYGPDDILQQLRQMIMTGYLEDYTLDIIDTNRILHRIKKSSICIIEAKSHTIIIRTDNETIITRQFSLDSILPLLGADFVRCQKRYIINVNLVQTFDKSSQYVNIKNILIPIGRTYYQSIKEALNAKENERTLQ